MADVLIHCRLGTSSPIEFLIDSGADANIIGGQDWDQLQREYKAGSITIDVTNKPNTQALRGYATDVPMEIECIFCAEIVVVETTKPPIRAEFIVVPNGRRSLLGRATASDLGLLKVGPFVNKCDVGEPGIFPKMPGVKVRFSVDRSVPPERNAYYNVPAAYREGAKRRLQEMEQRGIIERVRSAPEWISGMSAVPKGKDDFRLVVNMRAPNKAIKREYFRLPLIQEMKAQLHGAKFFTKLDLTSAFYHLELAKESRDLTTFLAESGMYRFTRLMFGVNCAPEIFQREMSRILKDIKNVIVYIDDILIFGNSIEDLRRTVAQVLQALRANNLSLNIEKCEFDKERINFLGHELDEQGFHIDEMKIKHIQKFREPTTASELRSFLGLASFISPYIRNFADITSPLWEVATTKTWTWGPVQSTAFEVVKSKIVRSTVALGYFSDKDRTILYTDASPNALGAVLVQEGKGNTPRIISFASKALTATEKRYAQNQREALGAVWAVEYFSYYLLGRHFTLRTDAKGVAFILNRSREDSKRALTRADGWALRLSPYSYTVEYVEGKFNIADPSSRLYTGSDDPFNEAQSPWEIARIEAVATGFLTEEVIRNATADDVTLPQVMEALESGKWTRQLHRYESVAKDLYVKNGMLVKQGCVVIPEALRKKTLEIAHKGHPMTAKLKSILRERVWWPGMPKDAEEWVKSCEACATNGRPEKAIPMERIFAPKTVWETVALDFNGPYARFGGIYILVLVEYRSRFVIARPVRSTSFENTRRVLEDIFDHEGFPIHIRTDNGPPFNGEDFSKYCAERGITNVFSTPLFPQQNGLAENCMKLINKAMATAVSVGTDYNDELQSAIKAHNSAAHSITKVPPEELMFGRKIRRWLPLLNPGKVNHDDEKINSRDMKAKLTGKQYEDRRRGAKRSQITPGDTVIIERHSRTKGESRFDPRKYTVTEQNKGNLVLTGPDGQQLKRHVTQTKRVHEWRAPDPTHKDQELAVKRQARERNAPVYLKDYIRLVHAEESAR